LALVPGTRLGPYEILAALGAGGMGEVYRARDTRLGRSVAVKVVKASGTHDPALRERFEREARAISALDHPHICPLYDVGQDAGVEFLVMPCLEGETLASRLQKGALPLDRAVAIATQIADALDRAHRAGFVHRDLKPANIMLTKGSGARHGEVHATLLDFGLAKLTASPVALNPSLATTQPPAQENLTGEATLVGTLQYMAPEQIEGKPVDGRADLFALGAILHEMITGRPAFARLPRVFHHRSTPLFSAVSPRILTTAFRRPAICVLLCRRWGTSIRTGLMSAPTAAVATCPCAPC
jgi:serine/threonine protein kinase